MTRWLALTALSLLAGCAYDSITPREQLAVGPRHASASRWNDYFGGTGEEPCESSDVRCRHVGLERAVVLPGAYDCRGVEIHDALGWLEWACEEDRDGVRVVAEHLRSGIGLADLIDTEARPPRWRDNAVIIARDGEPWLETARQPFWSDPVRVVEAGDAPAVLDEPGAIYVLGSDAPALMIEADHVAVLGAEGATLARVEDGAEVGLTARGRMFLWLERLRIDGYPIGAQLDVTFGVVRDLRIERASRRAMALDGRHVVAHAIAIADSASGLIAGTLVDSRIEALTVANVAQGGVLVQADGLAAPSENVTLYDAVVSNVQQGPAVLLAGHDHRAVRVVVAHNAAEGVEIDGDASVVQHLTAVSNAIAGYHVASESEGHQLVSALIVNNKNGAWLADGSRGTQVHDLLAVRNSADVRIEGDHNVFTGTVMITEPGTCGADPSLGPPLEPGLAIDSGCDASGDSTAVVTFGERVERLFAGRLSPSTELFERIDDWLAPGVRQQLYGLGGEHAFPSVALHGPCSAGDTCVVWDFRLDASVVKDRFGGVSELLDAAHVREHTWHAESREACARIDGARWQQERCETRFLAYADEPPGDGAGNDNGLCEAGERCTVNRNLGAYPGEGPLEPIDELDPGFFGSVTLLRHERNIP